MEVSDGVTVYKALTNKGQKRGRTYGARWAHIKYDNRGFPDSEDWHHLRATRHYYNPQTPTPGGWRLGEVGEAIDFETADGAPIEE